MTDRSAIDVNARLRRRRLLGVGGHENAAPVGPVGPAVIRTLEGDAGDYLAKRQTRSAMDAQVAPCAVGLAGSPQDEVLAQEPRRDRRGRPVVFCSRGR